jgi:hypothetical protein
MLVISLHLKNQYHRSPTVTMIITILSQTHDHKNVPMKPIISLIPNVDFSLVQYFTRNIFSIKEQKIYNGKYTHSIDIFPLETQTRKTNIFYIHSKLTPSIILSNFPLPIVLLCYGTK